MHRTLKAETTRPPAGNARAQQRRFNAFRYEFNHERPHEALHQETPASHYAPSPRAMPDPLPEVLYPAHFEVRRIHATGFIVWKTDHVFVSSSCAGESVGLEAIGAGQWDVYFCSLKLGRLIEEKMRIEECERTPPRQAL
jgi:putative transposase